LIRSPLENASKITGELARDLGVLWFYHLRSVYEY
jgi:hypothetical protein